MSMSSELPSATRLPRSACQIVAPCSTPIAQNGGRRKAPFMVKLDCMIETVQLLLVVRLRVYRSYTCGMGGMVRPAASAARLWRLRALTRAGYWLPTNTRRGRPWRPCARPSRPPAASPSPAAAARTANPASRVPRIAPCKPTASYGAG